MSRNIYCSRKGGATIKGKVHLIPTTSEILERQVMRQADKAGARRLRREAKQ